MRLVLLAWERSGWAGRRVRYELVQQDEGGRAVRRVSARTVAVPATSPLGAYAGPDVRRGLAEAQRLGIPFEDRSHFDAGR